MREAGAGVGDILLPLPPHGQDLHPSLLLQAVYRHLPNKGKRRHERAAGRAAKEGAVEQTGNLAQLCVAQSLVSARPDQTFLGWIQPLCRSDLAHGL